MANEYAKFLNYLASRREFSIRPGLKAISSACDIMGHPERDFTSIHIAGTNGKGSTAVHIESILRMSGYRTGLYTSPHLIDVRERIQINRQMISEREAGRLFNEIGRAVSPRVSLTYFELLTLMAFLYFSRQRVSFAVVEAGLGGRLDATNVISPAVAVITSISKDHTGFLGEELEDIAEEKCGIIKSIAPAITTAQPPSVFRVIKKHCRRAGSKLVQSWPFYKPLETSLAGRHQLKNAAMAAAVAEVLRCFDCDIKFNNRFLDVSWPGRLQKISDHPEIIADGAHNPDGCRVLAGHLRENYKRRSIIVIFGAMKDKALAEMTAPLKRVADGWVVCPPRSHRSASAGQLKAAVGGSCAIAADINNAIAKALEFGYKNPVIVVCGSLYLVGELLKWRAKAKNSILWTGAHTSTARTTR